MHISVGEVWTLVLAVLAIELGATIHKWIPRLDGWNIPTAITGGLAFAVLVTGLRKGFGWRLDFADGTRHVLLLIFFAGIGLSSKFKELIKGGVGVALICVVIVILISAQNIAGVFIARFFGLEPALGLFFGSISFAGGHGTAAAWSNVAQTEHIVGAFEIGMACATVGLIAGGTLAGPLATWLIHHQKFHLSAWAKGEKKKSEKKLTTEVRNLLDTDHWLTMILTIGICLVLGDALRSWLDKQNIVVPAFLTTMAIAIVLTNFADLVKRPIDLVSAGLVGTIALRLFLSMSMMGLQLWELATFIVPLMVTVVAQMIVSILLTLFILYPLLGRNYDAAVACGGFIGFSLGAMPVALGVMKRLSVTFGEAPRGFMLLMLAAALFTDTANAIIVNYGFSLLR